MSPNPTADSIDEYLDGFDDDPQTDDARAVIQLMRKELMGADERVQWGIAIFSRDRSDIAGMSIRKKHLSLYCPHSSVFDEYSASLGDVDCGRGCIRFKSLEDIDNKQLRGMIKACERQL